MTDFLLASLAATYLTVLVRKLIPADHRWQSQRPLGCSVCMSGWTALAVAWGLWRPSSWAEVSRFPVWWWATAALTLAFLELYERTSAPPFKLPPD